MAQITIERLHARYHDVDGDSAARLDRAMERLADEAFDRSLSGVIERDPFALCIDALDVEVRLSTSSPIGSIAERWADALAAAIDREIRTGLGVVVYARELDAVVDLCRCAVASDPGRSWALHQVGLIDGPRRTPGPVEVERALIARPTMIPALVGALPTQLPLTVDGWIRCARQFSAALPQPVSSATPSPTGARHRSTPGRRDRATVQVALEAVGLAPVDAWRAAAESDVAALIDLTIACVAPTARTDETTVAAVADEVNAIRLGHATDDAPATASRHRPADPDESATDGARAPRGRPTEPREATPSDLLSGSRSDAASAAEPATPRPAATTPDDVRSDDVEPLGMPVASAFGGVWYLAGPITDLDVVDEVTRSARANDVSIGAALAWMVERVTGVEASDAAVTALVGADPDVDLVASSSAAHPDLDRTVTAAADSVAAWFVDRLGDDDLDWVWRREATMEVEPGWIEVTFRLDDVDLRLRRSGIDFDPDFVWWRGAVVRFRHV
ncbi:MAG: hypothetical protein AAFY28_15725 [Actinomycetota bacterium]